VSLQNFYAAKEPNQGLVLYCFSFFRDLPRDGLAIDAFALFEIATSGGIGGETPSRRRNRSLSQVLHPRHYHVQKTLDRLSNVDAGGGAGLEVRKSEFLRQTLGLVFGNDASFQITFVAA